jgi:hypothetical protein
LPNTAWCGRGDGGMIFNSNEFQVAPPHTLVLEIWRSKEVYANQKYRGVSKRWLRGEYGNIVIIRTIFTPILKATKDALIGEGFRIYSE